MSFLLAVALMYPVDNTKSVIRINEVGYLPHDAHIAVICSLQPRNFQTFRVLDSHGNTVFTGDATPKGPYGPCVSSYDLSFSHFTREGTYRIDAQGVQS
ncbi:MAG TPA: cellulase N-terminal Ig-like domain-containing protein, partial [Candidatus Rubrimentiphilum sp.]|nr:cellulase N-terminal Ig-like domain-containing protein [Candidatus Rubrimentiphilum sp.]